VPRATEAGSVRRARHDQGGYLHFRPAFPSFLQSLWLRTLHLFILSLCHKQGIVSSSVFFCRLVHIPSKVAPPNFCNRSSKTTAGSALARQDLCNLSTQAFRSGSESNSPQMDATITRGPSKRFQTAPSNIRQMALRRFHICSSDRRLSSTFSRTRAHTVLCDISSS
jgi:hypothetical protein